MQISISNDNKLTSLIVCIHLGNIIVVTVIVGSTNYVVKIHNKIQNKLSKLTRAIHTLSSNDFTLWKIHLGAKKRRTAYEITLVVASACIKHLKSVLAANPRHIYDSFIQWLLLYCYWYFISFTLSPSPTLFWFFLFASFKQNMSWSWTFSSHLKWHVPSFSIQ